MADGARIAWTRWAGRSDATLVLVHGIGNDRATWFDVPERLAARGHDVLAIDLRGHGASSVQPPFGVECFAADLVNLLAERDIVRPLLVGHSLGALVCSMAARLLPVRGVINVDQSLRLTDLAVALRGLWPVLENDFHATIAAIFGSMMPPSLPAQARTLLDAQYARMLPEVTLSIWAPLARLAPSQLDEEVAQIVAGIRCPYLAVHGASAGDDYTVWLRQRVPGVGVELWEGGGHFPHLVDPARFVQRVSGFAAALT